MPPSTETPARGDYSADIVISCSDLSVSRPLIRQAGFFRLQQINREQNEDETKKRNDCALFFFLSLFFLLFFFFVHANRRLLRLYFFDAFLGFLVEARLD